MSIGKFTEEQIKEAVISSTSMSSVLLKLGLSPTSSGLSRKIREFVKNSNIDTKHFSHPISSKKTFRISDEEFASIVLDPNVKNIRQCLIKLGLAAKGGSYDVFKRRCKFFNLPIPYDSVPTTITTTKDYKSIRESLTDQLISEAVADNFSRMGTLNKLNLNPNVNTNVKWINEKISTLNLDTSHWTGQGHLKGKTHDWSSKVSLEKILVENSEYTCSYKLKHRLIKENILIDKCSACELTSWMNKEISLHLDHINGNHSDNRLDNLRLLCPNCHSQTPTYCRKKNKK